MQGARYTLLSSLKRLCSTRYSFVRRKTHDSMDNRLQQVKSLIGAHPDFPKKGVLFRDIFPVFRNPKVLHSLVDLLCEHVKTTAPDAKVIVGLESRGFLFGPMMAEQLGIAFAPIRKAGKLPGKCREIKYSLEYGTDTFEIQDEAIELGQSVVIVDDLIATGGTMKAAVDLVQLVGGKVADCLVVIELNDLNGRANLESNTPFHSLIKY